MVLDFNGKYDENIKLTFDEGVSTFGACPVNFQNEFYLFGGTNKHSKMVSHLNWVILSVRIMRSQRL